MMGLCIWGLAALLVLSLTMVFLGGRVEKLAAETGVALPGVVVRVAHWMGGTLSAKQTLPGIFVVGPLMVVFMGMAWWSRRVSRILLRHRAGECLACGYDLRGSVAAEKSACPECGAGFRIDAGVGRVGPK